MQLKLQIKTTCLSRISDTRWSCRYRNCKMVIDNYSAIIEVLKDEIDRNNDKDATHALGISIFKFLLY